MTATEITPKIARFVGRDYRNTEPHTPWTIYPATVRTISQLRITDDMRRVEVRPVERRNDERR